MQEKEVDIRKQNMYVSCSKRKKTSKYVHTTLNKIVKIT